MGYASYVKKLNGQGESILNQVRVFYGIPPKDDTFNDTFAAVFQKSDPSFSIRNFPDSYEAQILAGTVLAFFLEKKNPPVSDLVALALVCCHCQGLRSSPPITDMLTLSKVHLKKRAVEARQRDLQSIKGLSEINVSNQIEQIKGTVPLNDIVELGNLMVGTIQDLGTTISSQLQTAGNNIQIMHQCLLLQQEETNILWWLFSEYSQNLDSRYKDIELPFASLLAAKELDDLTSTLPGPASSHAFLKRILQRSGGESTNPISIQFAINSIKEARTSGLNSESFREKISDLCPIHLALEKSIEAGNDKAWVTAFENITKLSASDTLSPADLSYQYYQERILFRIFDLVNG